MTSGPTLYVLEGEKKVTAKLYINRLRKRIYKWDPKVFLNLFSRGVSFPKFYMSKVNSKVNMSPVLRTLDIEVHSNTTCR